MNWSRKSAYVMLGEHGYKVAKFVIDDASQYRAIRNGEFIGQIQDSFEDAAQVCESNFQIMGGVELEGVEEYE